MPQKSWIPSRRRRNAQPRIFNHGTHGIHRNKTGYKKTSVGWIPADWDLKTLGEIGSFSKGKGISNSGKLEFGYPCITYGDIYTKYDVQIKKFFSFIDEKSAKSSQRIYKGCILFAGSGVTLDDIGKCVAFDNNDEAYAGGDIIIFTPR